MKTISSLALGLLLSTALHAETADIKLKGVDTSGDTSIHIKKGKDPLEQQCIEYQIIDGSSPLHTVAQYDKSKAYAEWKTNCAEWKKETRELNKTNSLLSLDCGRPVAGKEGDQVFYESTATYRAKVVMREKDKN